MTREQWARLEKIFDEARALPAEAKSGFISQACGSDPLLGAQARSLLDADAASGDFMAEPALQRLARTMASDGWGLRSGESIGPYRVLKPLGAGGAGEVWQARDDRLGRDVAIKVLLPHVAVDAERLRRFADEARTAGALNHPNVLTVHDVGEHRGIPYLVSESLEGQNLRQRMEAGPFAIDEAISIALDVARGLTAAHSRSIVHRDLKPENTFLTSEGGVKILDFGLAKLQQSLEGSGISSRQTMTGVIVGTAGYMAPEQITGENVDARTDLFALGVMLYEMLAGRHPFRAGSTFETLHAVLTTSAPDLSSLSPRVPLPLSRVVMRLMAKAPGARFQSALDAIWALEQAATSSTSTATAASPAETTPRPSRRMVMIAAGVLTAIGLTAVWVLSSDTVSRPSETPLTQFTWSLPDDTSLASVPAVSPDSKYVAFAAGNASGWRLYVRERGAAAAVPLAATEGAVYPFWSPDGGWLGYFALTRNGSRLMKIPSGGGPAVSLANVLYPFGAAWSRTGTIAFAPEVILNGIHRINADGNAAAPLTAVETSRGDTSHVWPVFLPDGVHFLYFVRSARDERRGLYVGRVDQAPVRAESPLLRSDSNAVYVSLPGTPEGELLYVVDGRIEARRLDSRTMALVGEARHVKGVSAAGTSLAQPAMLAASAEMLVVATTSVPWGNRLEAVDRTGRRLRVWESEAQGWPRISPDKEGRYLARQRVDPLRNTPDIWNEDLQRGTSIQVTTALEPDIRPVWSPDGGRLAYVSGNVPGGRGTRVLAIAAADGTGVLRTMPCPGEYCEPTDWTPRGLLVNVLDAGRRDVWVMPIEGGASAEPLLATPVGERDARMSPDGKWIAYVSDEGGRPEVSIRSLSAPVRRIPVSGRGGDHPVWRRDGSELFFVDPDGQLQTVAVVWSVAGPVLGLATKVNIPPIGRGHWGTPYDVSPDGSRIYFLRRNDDPGAREIRVILGWRALLS